MHENNTRLNFEVKLVCGRIKIDFISCNIFKYTPEVFKY